MTEPTNMEDTRRLPTGVSGLDKVMHGGLAAGAIYLVLGRPGAGKSILANQIAYAHVKRKGRAVYATLLAETHSRLLLQLKNFSFFDPAAVGKDIVYLNGMASLEAGGLDALLVAVQRMVREQGAELLLLDGLLPPSQLGATDLQYKKFIAALQSWVLMQDCTVVILTTGPTDVQSAEHTMVDGIIEISTTKAGMRTLRELAVTKLRGSSFAEGQHAYVVSDQGVEVFPRMEVTHVLDSQAEQPMGERVPSGIPGLDAILGGGLIRGSSTLVLGSSGSGKSIAGLQFVCAGAALGEPSLHFGYYEPPHALEAKGARLGLGVQELRRRGLLHLEWRTSAENILDREARDLLATIERHKIRRVLFDGFASLKMADHPERVSGAFSMVTNELSRRGVTMMVTDETRELFVREVQVPTPNVSGIAHNIIFLRQVEIGAELHRLISIMKTRDSAHDRRLWEFEISDRGVAVRTPFNAVERGLMGGGKGEAATRPDHASES